jgi:sugar O-acyltransferase (sialic acid O-acetyltransferase NeuD family)
MKIYMIGAGGHAFVVLDCAKRLGMDVLGVFAKDEPMWGSDGPELLGDDAAIEKLDPKQVLLLNGIGGVRSTQKRREAFERWKSRGFKFASIIHPTAFVADPSGLAEGVQVMAGSIVQAGVKIGVNTIINTRASIDHHCLIGDHVHIAPGAVLSGEVTLAEGVHVGTGATLIQGIKVGAEALIAAGAVVVGDLPARAVVMGIPAKGKI